MRTEADPLVGDINGDDDVNTADVDLLFAAVRNNDPDSRFDLNGDLQVDDDDVAYLLTDVLNVLTGDTDLNGIVDFDDFLQLARAFGQSDQGWAGGDFDGNGITDFEDFLSLSRSFGQSRPLDQRTLAFLWAGEERRRTDG